MALAAGHPEAGDTCQPLNGGRTALDASPCASTRLIDSAHHDAWAFVSGRVLISQRSDEPQEFLMLWALATAQELGDFNMGNVTA
jgi:hypothetical protein